jgi:protoheme IX farnesyltransferase
MSTSTLVRQSGRTQLLTRLRDYLELTKPKIAILELLTVAGAAFVASRGSPDGWVVGHVWLGAALVAASASALNQWLEQSCDACMERTAHRPLPSGRLGRREVLVFGAVTALAGFIYLALAVNWLTAALGLLTWTLYVWIYTPLKGMTPANTVVGAVAGALPVLMGVSAVGGRFDMAAATLFLIVFLWQFPHFMAISWIYRRQYSAAGSRMLSVVDPSGRRAAVQALMSALALVPVSLLPNVLNFAGTTYFALALALGLVQLACAALFVCRTNDVTARLLLRASLVYLPSLFLMLVFGPFS